MCTVVARTRNDMVVGEVEQRENGYRAEEGKTELNARQTRRSGVGVDSRMDQIYPDRASTEPTRAAGCEVQLRTCRRVSCGTLWERAPRACHGTCHAAMGYVTFGTFRE